MDRVDVNEYSVIIGSDNGRWTFKALRHGEEWIEDLTMVDGSNMIMTMAYEIQRLRNNEKATNELTKRLINCAR